MPKAAAASVSIVGPGNLGAALARSLPSVGYPVKLIAVRKAARASSRAKALARSLKARLVELGRTPLDTDIIWITVPDDAIATVAERLAPAQSWQGKIVFHSSGALSSDALAALRARGARAASVHPMMTFVRGAAPDFRGVSFALEGDRAAVAAARRIIEKLGGTSFVLKPQSKVLYHAFGSFASPLLVALLATMEQVAQAAGVRRRDVKQIAAPLLLQTLRNYLASDAASAFSGPLVRGDAATVRKHLARLNKLPAAREVYRAVAIAALNTLPVKNRKALRRELAVAVRPRAVTSATKHSGTARQDLL